VFSLIGNVASKRSGTQDRTVESEPHSIRYATTDSGNAGGGPSYAVSLQFSCQDSAHILRRPPTNKQKMGAAPVGGSVW